MSQIKVERVRVVEIYEKGDRSYTVVETIKRDMSIMLATRLFDKLDYRPHTGDTFDLGFTLVRDPYGRPAPGDLLSLRNLVLASI